MRILTRCAVAQLFLILGSTATDGRAESIVFEYPLDGAQASTPSPAKGTGRLILDTDTNAIMWEVCYADLMGAPTDAHFHGPALPGNDAGVQVQIGVGNPVTGDTLVSQKQAAEIQAGLWYVNVRSTAFPAGEIRGQVVQAPPVAFGLAHTAAGQGAYTFASGARTMTISNIGSSGEDGVNVDLGEADGFRTELDFGLPGAMPPAGHIQLDLLAGGSAASGDDTPVLGLAIDEFDGGLAAVSSDLSFLEPAEVTVEVRHFGELTGSVTHAPPYPETWLTGALGAGVSRGLVFSNIGTDVTTLFKVSSSPTLLSLTGGPASIPGDEIRWTLSDAAGVMPLTTSGVRIRARDLGEIDVLDEAIGRFGHAHRALGEATMIGSSGIDGSTSELILSSIGPSGSDGVAIDVAASADPEAFPNAFTVEIAEMGPSGMDGAFLEYRASFLSEDAPPTRLAQLRLQEVSSILQVRDFRGPSTVFQGRVIVRNGGLERDVVKGVFGGFVATLIGDRVYPTSFSVLDMAAKEKAETPAVHGVLRWEVPQLIAVAGSTNGAVFGDELIIEAILPGDDSEDPDGTGIDLVEIRARSIDPIIITGEEAGLQPVPPDECPADVDGNGTVDVVDLLAVILEWGCTDPPGRCTADVNDDDVVDVLDLLDTILAWGDC